MEQINVLDLSGNTQQQLFVVKFICFFVLIMV